MGEKHLHTLHPKHSPEEPIAKIKSVLRACLEARPICSYSLSNARAALASSSTTHSVAEARSSRGQQSPTGLPILRLKTPPPGPNDLPRWPYNGRLLSPLRSSPEDARPSPPLCPSLLLSGAGTTPLAGSRAVGG